ncbi:MAG: ATP-binding protein, partial [Thermoplasmata archaeon]|nr:ATP-binding protein [Thermoplasmata archaeon]
MKALTHAERQARDEETEARISPAWRTELILTAGGEPSTEEHLDRWASLVATASAGRGRGRLEFRPAVRWFRRRPSAIFLSELELLGILPSESARIGGWRGEDQPGVRRIPLGTEVSGDRAELEVPLEQGRHMVILGETGMGKSSLLVRVGCAAASLGNLVLFDPVGDTGRSLIARLPSRRVGDVVWISPRSSPVSLDLLASLRGSDSTIASVDRRVSDLVAALRRVRAARYSEAPFWGPRIEET